MFNELFAYMNADKPAAGFMPGCVTGVVTENQSSEHPGMVKVEYFLGDKGRMASQWMQVLRPYAPEGAGVYFQPETGDQVVVLFLGNSPDCPLVIGSLPLKPEAVPQEIQQENNIVKMIKTKGGLLLLLSEEEEKAALSLETPGGLTVRLADEAKTIEIRDKDGKNKVLLDGDKGEITLCADQALHVLVGNKEIISIDKSNLTMKSGAVSAEGSQKLQLKGQTANLQGSQIQVKADASLKLESGGMAEFKGSMVKVN